jgi:hypothetical protein
VSQEISSLSWDSPEFYPQAHAIAAKYVKFIEHKGKRILTIDCARADLQLQKAIAAEVYHVVSSQEPKSVRTLLDVEAAQFESEGVKVGSELAAKNRPYVLRGAVLGVKGLRYFALQTVISFSKRPMKLFENRQEALDWLAQEGEAE